jgi:hypothetical protein
VATKKAPTVQEIVDLRWELHPIYQTWHAQQLRDQSYYDLTLDVIASNLPDGFEAVIPPSATTVVDLTADHAAGNFPNLHVPRRKESAQAEDQSTLMERWGQGFWYRNIQNKPTNVLRAWAQSGALRGAVAGCLNYRSDLWPLPPIPSKYGGTESQGYKDALDEVKSERRSAWPFDLKHLDPLELYPDPASDGQNFVIHAYLKQVFDVVRDWPEWDRMVPGRDEPLRLTDFIEFIAYGDDTYRCYIVSGDMPNPDGVKGSLKTIAPPMRYGGVALGRGVVKHGYGFNPYFFAWGGFGSPFGKPEQKGRGILTNVTSLLSAEARRMTHLDAIVAQQAFPWILVSDNLDPDMQLGGVTRIPMGQDIAKAVLQIRQNVPIAEISQEIQLLRGAIQRATIPDSLGAEPNKSEESGYLRSLKIGTGRSRIRTLSNTIERAAAWATSGGYRLIDNKVKAPVPVWGAGMGSEREFVTLGPDDIKGHYEVYCTLTPSLPNDESVDIRNGIALYEHGLTSGRDVMETYAGRENATELLRERYGEDMFKSPQYQQKLVNDAMGITNVTTGAIAVPGVRSSGEVGLAGGPSVGAPAAPQPGVPALPPAAGVPAPASPPSAAQQMANVVGRTQRGGLPLSAPGGTPR